MQTLRHLLSSYDEYHNCIIRSWLTLFSVICTFSATLFQHFKLFLSQPPTLSTLHVFVQRIFVFFLSRNSGTFSHILSSFFSRVTTTVYQRHLVANRQRRLLSLLRFVRRCKREEETNKGVSIA